MEWIIVAVFLLGYTAIAMESPLRVNKTAVAVLLAVFCWVIYAVSAGPHREPVTDDLRMHLSAIAEILFFLMGAMTIVELIDSHKGFRFVTQMIRTGSGRKLLWIISLITFFLSAVLDNLTTSIVMVSVLKKIMSDRRQRLLMSSTVVIAANAGGAWSPIGDVTTTMLWIGGQVSAAGIMKALIIPGMVSLLVPLACLSFFVKGRVLKEHDEDGLNEPVPYSQAVFFTGLGCLMMIPVFKAVTHLPPYMGMLLGLGLLWLFTELVHGTEKTRHHLRISTVLSRIDLSSILFFLGILLSVAALETSGALQRLAEILNQSIGQLDWIVLLLGFFSAVVDNVPLVAATMGMYPLSEFPQDHRVWELIAFSAGTGGSMLIIGSAAGVVVMGMERIEFFWYLKNISFLALLGYLSGFLTYLWLYPLLR